MLTEIGVVSRVEAEGVWVRSQRQSACGACKARAGCGQKLLYQVTGSTVDVFARYPTSSVSRDFNIGDQVEIEVSENAIVIGSLLIYLLPLSVFIISLVILESVLLAPLWLSLLGASALLVAAVQWVRAQVNSSDAQTRFQPSLVRKLNAPSLE